MTEKAILNIFKKTNALLTGHFLLSSGLHSPNYLQCALLLADPKVAGKLCKLLAAKIKELNPTIVVAPALGGVLVSYEVARALKVKGVFTERVDGNMCLRRGFSLSKEDKVLVVEDVITTGKSTNEVIDVVKSCGAQLVGVASIADRSGGKVNFSVPQYSLIKVDIPAYKGEDCPLCKQNIPVVKPGSRNIR